MAAVIRLKRVGAKKDPSFRIVVADSRRARDGRFIEQLGFYDPQPREAQYRVDVERTLYWLGLGAQASDQVRSLLRKAGVSMPSRATKKKKAAESERAKSKSGAKSKPAKASTREQARRMRKRKDRAARKSQASKTKARAAAAAAPAEAAPVS